MKIVCLDGGTLYPTSSESWKVLGEYGEYTVYDRTSESDIQTRAADADIILTNKVPMCADTIKALPKLKYIGVLATGYNIVDIAAARRAGVIVTNIPTYSTMSVAQHTIALLLALTSRIESYAASVNNGTWSSSADFSYRLFDWHELAGKTFGIVGFGNIGSAVARIAEAMGMKIAVFTSKAQDELPAGYLKMTLDELFISADVVSLHCPLTNSTKGLVDERRLSMMKPTAILLNTGRGPLVDEAALAKALNGHTIYGAGLDVLSKEPPAPDCPLLSAPNCLITPHIAWASAEARERLLGIAGSNIKAFLDGAPVNVVD